MKPAHLSLARIFASALAAALPIVASAACSSAGGLNGTPNCVDNPHTVPFTRDAAAPPDAGVDCYTLCHSGFCDLNADGKNVTCHTDCTGRRPEGLAVEEGASPCTLGEYFAEIAHLEAASIDAFRVLQGELTRFRAPARLVHAARRARRDEERHVRLTSALARRFGGTPRSPKVATPRARTLVELAIENAVEGCVRETFGALVAHYQARAASDLEVRAAMARIARDETAHAELAWRTHAWAIARLTRVERARVRGAMHAAAHEILGRQAQAPDALTKGAGIPDPATSAVLAWSLHERLWAA